MADSQLLNQQIIFYTVLSDLPTIFVIQNILAKFYKRKDILEFFYIINFYIIKQQIYHYMEANNKEIVQQLAAKFNLQKGLASNLLKSEISQKAFIDTVKFSGLTQGQKKVGNMLYKIATQLPVIIEKYRENLANDVGTTGISNANQLDFAINYLKNNEKQGGVNLQNYKKDCGIGVKLTLEQLKQLALVEINLANEQSQKKTHFVQFKDKVPFVEGKVVKQIFDNLWKEKGLPQNVAVDKKKEKAIKKETKDTDKKIEQKVEQVFRIKDIAQLIGREMNSAVNTAQNLKKRKQQFGDMILTRFPPQPNGYLHIGHCKAMRFNFMQARMTKGGCYLRFDDTNPLKQNVQFIQNIKQNIKWMGYEPWKITHASDNFDKLFEYAVKLIKQGDAFVCSDIKQEMKKNRSESLPSKDRDRPIQQNLRLFQEMKLGLYKQGQYSLCAKIDYKHPNTTLRDPVIYRIRYTPHPHVGDKWCIYPLYDYTHPLSDSIQGITHSLCSLEFQIRRQLYYWVLDKLNLYKPNVWQYSRLNITNTVLSKRKLHQLIFTNRVNGWDDPRILTINGMRRRGYPAQAINNFCDEIGVTRRGNQNYISFGLLQHEVRKHLDITAPRTMTVLDPVQVIIQGVQQQQLKIPLFPKFEEKGHRTIKFSNKIYVDRQNIQLESTDDFYGIAPNKIVGLKYASTILIKEIQVENNVIKRVKAVLDDSKKKPNSFLHWIATDQCIDCEVRLYDVLFTIPKPNEQDNFIDFMNQDSIKIIKDAKCHSSILNNLQIMDRWQFQRKGFFCLDFDSKIEEKKLVWNMTVGLQDKRKK